MSDEFLVQMLGLQASMGLEYPLLRWVTCGCRQEASAHHHPDLSIWPLTCPHDTALDFTRVGERERKQENPQHLLSQMTISISYCLRIPAVFIMVGTHKSVITKTHKSVNTRGTSARLATTRTFLMAAWILS